MDFFREKLILSVLLGASLFFIIDNEIYAQEDPVLAKSLGLEKTTIIEFENNGSSEIKTFRLWLGTDFTFKSFKTEQGWIGNKTPQGVLVFSTENPVKSGESVKFGIKTDKAKPGINWKALDNNEVSLQVGKTLVSDIPGAEKDTKGFNPSNESLGVFPESTFRLVPEKPRVGSTVRVSGDHFGANQPLDLFLGNKKLESFETNEDGYFIITTKIPQSEKAERVNFIVKDKEGNQKEFSLRLGEAGDRIISGEDIPLTLENLPSVMYRGDVVLLSGTAKPGGSVTASINSPNGEVITTEASEVDKNGNWSYDTIIPLDAPLGKYSATISDGKNTLLKNWIIESADKIQILPIQLKFEPGETIKFNGTAIPNQDLEIIIENPQGNEVYSDVIRVDKSGFVEINFETSFSTVEGTYALFAKQGDETVITLVGLGELPVEQLIAKMDKLNYKSNDKAIITVDGPPSSTLSLLIVDPSDKNKFTDTLILGPDGSLKYDLELSGYSSGVYTVVVTRGNAQTSEIFSVGLQTGSGPIELRTTKTEYLPGDPILILGNSGANILLTLSLIDPDGTEIKVKETFTNKNGVLSEDSLRVPIEAKTGIWTVRAESGSNFDIVEFTVLPSEEEGMSVFVEKIQTLPTGKLATIKGFGASISQSVEIIITSPEGDEFEPLKVFSSKVGEFQVLWNIPKNSIPGKYTVTASDAIDSAKTTFLLE